VSFTAETVILSEAKNPYALNRNDTVRPFQPQNSNQLRKSEAGIHTSRF